MSTLLTRAPASAVTRRQLLGGTGLLLLAAACGREQEQTAPAGGSGPFPAQIEHQHGVTTVRGVPRRVVAVGLTDHDPLLALGVEPLGVAEWYGDYPYATWPWAQGQLGAATSEIIGGSESYEFETIAALQPDLITGVYSGMTAGEYRTLSQIAPTVAQSGQYPDYGTPWQQMTRTLGRAVGREQATGRLIGAAEQRFAAARRAHPGFRGKTAAFVLPAPEGGYNAYTSADTRGRFLSSFGFTIPPRIEQLAGDRFYAELSPERLGLLDGLDLVVWDAVNAPAGKIDELRNSDLYQQLSVARQGRSVFVQDKVTLGAIAWSTVLSLPLAIDRMVPQLAAAVDGSLAP